MDVHVHIVPCTCMYIQYTTTVQVRFALNCSLARASDIVEGNKVAYYMHRSHKNYIHLY